MDTLPRPSHALPLLFAVFATACDGAPTAPSSADLDAASAPDLALAAEAAPSCQSLRAAGSTFSSFDLTPGGPVPLAFYPLADGGPPVVPGFQSNQSISLEVDGEDLSAGLVVTTKLLGDEPKGSGTSHATTWHVFELAGSDGDSICEPGEDCFQTADRTILRPKNDAGLFDLHGFLTPAFGHGRFAGVRAHPPLVALGEIQFAPAAFPTVASWEMSGNLCTDD